MFPADHRRSGRDTRGFGGDFEQEVGRIQPSLCELWRTRVSGITFDRAAQTCILLVLSIDTRGICYE